MRTRRFVPESEDLAAVNRFQNWAFSNFLFGFLLLKPGKSGVHKTVFSMRTRRFDPFNSMQITFITELVQGVFWSTVISKQITIHRFQVCTLVKVRSFYLHSVPDKTGCKNSLGQGGAKMGQDGAKMCQDEPRWRQWSLLNFLFGFLWWAKTW